MIAKRHDRSMPRWVGIAVALLLGLAAVQPAHAQDATTLKARHASMRDRLANNQFGRPIFLESAQTAGDLKGDIYSVVDFPFATVADALKPIDHWCDILILHLNVKACKAGGSGGAGTLSVAAGKKFDQPIEDAYKLEFAYKLVTATADYLQVNLSADDGPLGTKNYRIQLQATPIDARHSFIHMSYSYGYGMAARIAMQAYLATIGRDKVGFSFTERRPDGQPAYVGSVLGLIERNTMRYYLAIDSYLGAYALPAAEQPEKRLRTWYGATERYATQLHEMDQNEYMEMKHNEIRRQRGEAK
ncbi:MAG: hypothetical protein ABI809_08160 [Caldimonas sp.]